MVLVDPPTTIHFLRALLPSRLYYYDIDIALGVKLTIGRFKKPRKYMPISILESLSLETRETWDRETGDSGPQG